MSTYYDYEVGNQMHNCIGVIHNLVDKYMYSLETL